MPDYTKLDVKNYKAPRTGVAGKVAAVAATLAVGLGGAHALDKLGQKELNQETATVLKQQRDASAEYAKYEAEQTATKPKPAVKSHHHNTNG